VPRLPYTAGAVPPFDAAPPVVLVAGALEFFVAEAAAQAAELLSPGGVERLRFDDDAPAEAVTDALLNRSLFAPRRLVEIDATRLFGSTAPGTLYDEALAAWEKGTPGGRREAFRQARALLSALEAVRGGDPAEIADAVAKKVRRKRPDVLAEILRDLPEEKGPPALLVPALRTILDRGNDGVVALLTATAPPAGVELFEQIARRGLVLEVAVRREEARAALSRFARARAEEREVALDADAVERLAVQTDEDPGLFAAELSKLFDWAGKGGRVRAADVRANVADEASEDVYAFFDAVGRRDAADSLSRLERLFSGRDVRMGDKSRDRAIETDEGWPQQFLGMFTAELRRMLLLRAALAEIPGWDPRMRYDAFEARVAPRLEEPVPPFGDLLFTVPKRKWGAFALYKAAQRAARYEVPELARALGRAADLDVQLKSSIPVLEAFTAYVGRLIAGS
jgi:DNA polymerase III delta subunit